MVDESQFSESIDGKQFPIIGKPDTDDEGGDVLHLTVHHALLAAVCQFIPIPFLDEVVGDRVVRRLVDKLLERRGRDYGAEAVAPLFEGPERGVTDKIGGFFKGLVMKPVKKLLRTAVIVITIRRAMTTAARVLLLGRTIDRCLARGELADEAPDAARRKRAAQIEAAVRGVMASPERRGLLKLLRECASWLREDGAAPQAPVSAVADADAAEASLTSAQRTRLNQAANELEVKLLSDGQRDMLASLDAAVDARLQSGT